MPKYKYLTVPKEKLLLPSDCPSAEVIAAIYFIPRNEQIKKAQLFDVICNRRKECPIDCLYRKLVPLKIQQS
jgi:hypothetical protein